VPPSTPTLVFDASDSFLDIPHTAFFYHAVRHRVAEWHLRTVYPQHERAAAFADSIHDRDEAAISELMLLELYNLLRQGGTEFATVTTKDFEGWGFERVWNPLSSSS